ncbi:hypothetical protein [Halocalculus aciditolerans]|uniref:Uncharacterized protein n=1 Tax=Halocalculus aciditolerans TaxID=1383812 RepID=A0A830F3Z0_9EURY|nr:hypothetical protein [Halocalculus aciditolerans]GGL60296.1 hypothetical protein GCM10009039_18190 [Halocalculus aciditolerans]
MMMPPQVRLVLFIVGLAMLAVGALGAASLAGIDVVGMALDPIRDALLPSVPGLSL